MQLSAIRDNIRLVTLVESNAVTDAELTTIINQGLHEIEVAYDWPFLQASSTMSTSDSTRTIATPADLNRAIALIDDDNDDTVPFVTPNQFWAMVGNDTGNESTTQSMWTLFKDTVYLSPIPSDDDTNRYTFIYYKTITELSGDTDVPEFHKAFHWSLVEYGKWRIYEREEYYDQALQSKYNFAGYVDNMMRFYARQIDSTPAVFGMGRRPRRLNDINIPWWPFFSS